MIKHSYDVHVRWNCVNHTCDYPFLTCLLADGPMSINEQRNWIPSTVTERPLSNVHNVVVDRIWTSRDSSSSL